MSATRCTHASKSAWPDRTCAHGGRGHGNGRDQVSSTSSRRQTDGIAMRQCRSTMPRRRRHRRVRRCVLAVPCPARRVRNRSRSRRPHDPIGARIKRSVSSRGRVRLIHGTKTNLSAGARRCPPSQMRRADGKLALFHALRRGVGGDARQAPARRAAGILPSSDADGGAGVDALGLRDRDHCCVWL